jgi:hypothetical protein
MLSEDCCGRVSTLQAELAEERGLAAALAGSQAEWQARAHQREEAFLKEVTVPPCFLGGFNVWSDLMGHRMGD